MTVQSVSEITTAGKTIEFPDHNLAEFAFWGRSNVGKSTLINKLLASGTVAKASKNAGKTRRVHFFEVKTPEFIFSVVDMPGYGYARVSKDKRLVWEGLISDYLIDRNQLIHLFLLVDASIPPQKIDQETIEKLQLSKVPFSVVFTKTDKAKQAEVDKTISLICKLNPSVQRFQTSTLKKTGFSEIQEFMEKTLAKLDVEKM